MMKTMNPLTVQKALLCIVSSFFFYACTSSATKVDEDVISVDTNQDNLLKMSEFIDSVHYLPLETNDSCLISEVSQFFPLKDKMAIVDYRTFSIYFFDNNGAFLYKINKRGIAPQEYVKMTYVDMDEAENRIYLYDAPSNRILFYTMQGEYVGYKKVELQFTSMAYLGEGLFALYLDYYRNGNETLLREKETPLLAIYNIHTGEVKQSALYESIAIDLTETLGTNNNFSKSDGICFFNCYLNNHIYVLDMKGEIIKVCPVDFGSGNEERLASYKDVLKQETVSPESITEKMPDIYMLQQVKANESFSLISSVNYNIGKMAFSFHSFKTGDTFSGIATRKYPVQNDIDGGYPLIPRAMVGNKTYSFIQPMELDDYREQCEALSKLELEEDANPVVMIATVKDKFMN